ncbi:hypothetical protein CR152_06610 [Massilia violaceinigra]|uniref:Beta-ketoacyl synthase N-terminal domain-containing protein n=2 Tax=Massilia violaceinigra TaxID=2045208 RepID=A0A2D2DGU6_9BURK|nr:hypothetical protein CR152_06610 [Massilia violaceinigra]
MDANLQLEHVLIASVDSACEPGVLADLASRDLIFGPGHAQGFVPGEAAACVLLKRAAHAGKIPATKFALHRPALIASPSGFRIDDGAPDASSLAQALARALDFAAMEAIHISHLESDMDGSDWRALLEANALNRVIFSVTTALPQWRPATLLGQTGIPSGLIGWILPAVLHAQGIEQVNTVLNWSVDASGQCAACVLERSPY